MNNFFDALLKNLKESELQIFIAFGMCIFGALLNNLILRFAFKKKTGLKTDIHISDGRSSIILKNTTVREIFNRLGEIAKELEKKEEDAKRNNPM